MPQAIRCDNGPELTSRHFLAWCIERKIELTHIQPRRPMQNGHMESFHGKLRDECLSVVREFVGSPTEDHRLAKRVQPGAVAQQSRVSDTGGVCVRDARRERLWKRWWLRHLGKRYAFPTATATTISPPSSRSTVTQNPKTVASRMIHCAKPAGLVSAGRP